MKALVKGTCALSVFNSVLKRGFRPYPFKFQNTTRVSVFSRVLKRGFRLFRWQGSEFGSYRFKFHNKTRKFGDAPFAIAIRMLH